MFSPDALKTLCAGTLSDLELSSDDEEPFGFTSERELQSIRVGADVINQNQREVFTPDTEEDEGPSSLWIRTNDPGVTDTCDEVVLEVPPTTETESSHENILQNIKPKQNIRWRHKELLNNKRPREFSQEVAYREYQIDNALLDTPKNKQLTLLQFRRQLAESLVLRNKIIIGKRGRPSGSSPIPQIIPRRPEEIRPVADLAKDGVGHFPAHDEGLGTLCKMVGCKGRTSIKCIKCKVQLCLTKDKNCFLVFHT
ncbi:unnamed protein product [Danaus chrysippus]|uniref:(African queen) hypothetical protein n=1 Tax=Danaus chrysippus TaxID=151541 RepID=A0A8J2VQ65_9NEOP|nr:unnamed protein product [Danaus chrysippus]